MADFLARRSQSDPCEEQGDNQSLSQAANPNATSDLGSFLPPRPKWTTCLWVTFHLAESYFPACPQNLIIGGM